MGQNVFENASLSLFYSVNFLRYQWRYRHERALRNLYIESGRLMQKTIVIAEYLDAGSFITPALKDHKLASLLNLDTVDEVVLYSQTIGKKIKSGGE